MPAKMEFTVEFKGQAVRSVLEPLVKPVVHHAGQPPGFFWHAASWADTYVYGSGRGGVRGLGGG